MRVLRLCRHEGCEGESDGGEEDAQDAEMHSGAMKRRFDGPKKILYVFWTLP